MKSHVKLVIVIVVLSVILVALVGIAAACNGGKCTNPLPPNANGCDSQGKGPEHKCNPATEVVVRVTEVAATPKPIEVTKVAEPTDSPATRIATVVATVKATKESKPVTTPVPTATVAVTVGIPPATACGDDVVCDPCVLLLQAIEDGMIVMIVNQDQIVMVDGNVIVEGSLLATGLLSETTID